MAILRPLLITLTIALVATSLLPQSCTAEVTTESITASRRVLNAALRTYLENGTRAATRDAALRARDAIVTAGSCNVSVCFALDGSAPITSDGYHLQQLLVAAIGAVLGVDTDSTFAAVQFATTSIAITPSVTSAEEFIYSVGNSSYNGADGINLAAGMGYCGFQVAASDSGRQAVVVLGSGQFTVGFAPQQVAEQILPPEGRADIYGVSTAGDLDDMLPVVGDFADRIELLRDAASVGAVVERLVEGICDVEVCSKGEVSDECPSVVVEGSDGSEELADPSSEAVEPSVEAVDE